MGVPKEWWEVSEPTWAEFGGWWWHLARGTIYALHKAAREPNCCLLVLGGGRLLLLQRLRRLWEVKWETAVAAALFSAPLSPHITEISPQTFPSPALLPLHITSADPLSLDPSASAPLHLQGRDERRGAHGVQVQTQHKNAFFSTSPPAAFFSSRRISRLTTGHELSMSLCQIWRVTQAAKGVFFVHNYEQVSCCCW